MANPRNLMDAPAGRISAIAIVMMSPWGCATYSAPEIPTEPRAAVAAWELPHLEPLEPGGSLLHDSDETERSVGAKGNLPDVQGPAFRANDTRRWPTPTTPHRSFGEGEHLPPRLAALWRAYRSFHYRDVLNGAAHVVSDNTASSSDRATAFLLAGASAYLLGDTKRAMDCFALAAETDPSVTPNSMQFPPAVLRLYREAAGR